jgi:hypothetical protein
LAMKTKLMTLSRTFWFLLKLTNAFARSLVLLEWANQP